MRTAKHGRAAVIRTVAGVTGALLVIAGCGGEDEPDTDVPSGEIGGTVSVVGSWSGAEQDSFIAMVAPWEEATGATVEYTGSRDLQTQLTTGIASGNLPDVAGIPGPGLMKEWYDQGALQPLDFVDFDSYSGATPAGFAELGQAEDGTLIGVFTKAAVKGLIYYNTANWTEDPTGDLGRLGQRRRVGGQRRREDLVRRSRVGRRVWLARHRLAGGHHPSSVRS